MKQVIACVLTVLICASYASAADKPGIDKPNFVFILVDDLGWMDVGFNGSKYYETPHLDRLAAQGMRFTDAYAACAVCSPTRASIMTGKYPARLHLTDWIAGEGNSPKHKLRVPQWTMQLPLEEVTIAEALKPLGYVSANIGKWHLGAAQYYPEHQGFAVNIGGTHWGHPASYFWPYEGRSHAVHGLKAGGHEGEYLTDRLAAEAEKFIEQNKDRPFFLYLPHYAVHVPLKAKTPLIEKYRAKPGQGGQKNPTYAAMIESLDQSVGRILDKLDALGIAGRTVVVFTSDNGGLWPQATANGPLRAGKGFAYEGGIRVPLVIKWPGVAKAGSTCNVPVCSIDFLPTFAELAGAKPSGDVDGVSLVPLLKQSGPLSRNALYWHYPHYWRGEQVRPYGVVRSGDWKLIEVYEDMRVELYNLHDDLGEQHDLSRANPEKTGELREMLHAWRRNVDAQMPTPKP